MFFRTFTTVKKITHFFTDCNSSGTPMKHEISKEGHDTGNGHVLSLLVETKPKS